MNVPTATPTSSPTDSVPLTPERCSECESKETWIIHTVRLRGLLRTFCTHCLLRNHPSSFCPVCFSVYESHPHVSRRVSCSACLSSTHTHCLPEDTTSASYLCPPCKDPDTFSFFRPITGPDGVRCLDLPLSQAFLCASRIAVCSMNKAVQTSRIETERRGREAALARKRAREQLEQVVAFDDKEKARAAAAAAKVAEQKPKVLLNGGVKETESGVDKEQSKSVQLTKVKQEGGDASK